MLSFAQHTVTNVKNGDSLLLESENELKNNNYSKALALAKESLNILKLEQKHKTVGDCYNQIAIVYYYKGDFYKARYYFNQSKLYYKKANFKAGVAMATGNIGGMDYTLGNFSEALDHYKTAIALYKSLDKTDDTAGSIQNIGNIYYVLKNYNNAKAYYEKAEAIYKKVGDNSSLALVKSSLGLVYLKQSEYQKALTYLENALALATIHNIKHVQAEVLYNLGLLHKAKNELQTAIKYFNQAITIANVVEDNIQKSTALVDLGLIYLELNKIALAKNNCQKGFALAKTINSVSTQEEACQCLYQTYKTKGNTNKALYYYEQKYILKDSTNLKQTQDKILNMEFEKQTLIDSIAHVEKERKATLAHQKVVQKKETQRNIFIIVGCFALLLAVGIFSRLNFVKKSKARLQIEKDRSEHLLHNILPEEVAEELKEKGYVDAQDFETASILFTDFKSFTETASQLTPQELVEEINVCFKAFDTIVEQYQIEKIKTIGDAYMAAGGLPQPDANAVKNTILAALDMQTFVSKRKRENDLQHKPAFEMRVGIHVGPIVAGIVGVKKFQYDIWGDTVNTASRMESNSEVGKVNISQDTYLLVKDEKNLTFKYRGEVACKGKGKLKMYFVSKALL